MRTAELEVVYRVIGELLLHPDQRDTASIEEWLGRLRCAPPAVTEPLDAFLGDPAAWSAELYVQTLELAPPCPLYLGAYLFDEPKTCRDVGISGRNGYMLELGGVYRHFGLEVQGGELPDYLPLMVEFLGISLERAGSDRIGLRRRFLEHYVRPGLAPLQEALTAHESPYARLVAALEAGVEADLEAMGDTPAWMPRDRTNRRSLPVLATVTHGDAAEGG